MPGKSLRWLASTEFSNSQGCIDDAGRRHGSGRSQHPRSLRACHRQEKFQVTSSHSDAPVCIEDNLARLRSCSEGVNLITPSFCSSSPYSLSLSALLCLFFTDGLRVSGASSLLKLKFSSRGREREREREREGGNSMISKN